MSSAYLQVSIVCVCVCVCVCVFLFVWVYGVLLPKPLLLTKPQSYQLNLYALLMRSAAFHKKKRHGERPDPRIRGAVPGLLPSAEPLERGQDAV